MIAYRSVPALLILLMMIALAVPPRPARAALAGVSSIDPTLADPSYTDFVAGDAASIPPLSVATSLANGFPLWYQDGNGRKLELCLQQAVIRADTGASFFPCLTAEPILTRPIAFPTNFGSEAFYWAAVASGTYTASDGSLNRLLAVLAHEITFPNLILSAGSQTTFTRIRLRIDVPVPGTYRVTHPFGSIDYTVPTLLAGREINQTQDLGLVPLDFLSVLGTGPTPAPGEPADPAISAETGGVVSSTGANIGPYLGEAGAAPILDTDGNLYLSDPGTNVLHVSVPLEPGPNGIDYFEVELLDPPAGFQLNPANPANPQAVRISRFQISGKLFNDGPNLPPVAADDSASTVPGQPVRIDVLANDSDPRQIDLTDPFNPLNPANSNVHGLNPQALGLLSAGGILLTEPLTTPRGATVRRVIDAPSGRAEFLYFPRDDASAVGEDSFEYVVQDRGGLISAPATVTVTVEDLQVQRAAFRPRTGKWEIAGTSSDVSDNQISIYTGLRAHLTGDHLVFPATTTSSGTGAFTINAESLDYRLQIDPQPRSRVSAIVIRLSDTANDNPVIFTLFDSQFDPPFDGRLEGRLGVADLNFNRDAGITGFTEAAEALNSGRAYLEVQTLDLPVGEIRGMIGSTLIGSAPVAPDGRWKFRQRSTASPGGMGTVNVISSNGSRIESIPFDIR